MHIKNMLNIPNLDIVAVSDIFIKDIHDGLETIDEQSRYADYRDLLALSDLDAVFIFTSTNTHEEVIINAAEAGKHIFCEKPLSMSLNEESSLRVLRKVKEKQVKLQIAFNRRFDPQFHEVHRLVRAGEIGQPQMVKITSRDPDLLPHDLIKKLAG
ncbi:Gfo/Idh/MocA family oxidoreductase (plasmid) [Klebsiella grimontii]